MSAIDDLITEFYDRIATLSWKLRDYRDWVSSYEKMRDNGPDWVTKDGRRMKLRNISEDHLENLISYVQRRDPDNTTHWYDVLKAEKKYRELKREIPLLEVELTRLKYLEQEL